MARRAADGGLAAEQALAAAAQETALGRIATAEEVAQTVLFLASDLASGVTGQVVAGRRRHRMTARSKEPRTHA